MGVHFFPKIELSYGFTLNGLGGIIALDRRLAEDELLKGIREGALNQILFPDDPIAAAPKISIGSRKFSRPFRVVLSSGRSPSWAGVRRPVL